MDSVSVHTEMAPELLHFAADMYLQPFTHGMRGPTGVSAQGFARALDFFLSRHASSEVSVVRVESESVFPPHHYPVPLRLVTLPALVAPGNPTSRARFKLGSSVCRWQRLPMAAGGFCGQLQGSTFNAPSRSTGRVPPFCRRNDRGGRGGFRATQHPGHGACTPDTVPGLVSSAASVLHAW